MNLTLNLMSAYMSRLFCFDIFIEKRKEFAIFGRVKCRSYLMA